MRWPWPSACRAGRGAPGQPFARRPGRRSHCLSGCADLAEVLTEDKRQTLFAADRSIAPQLGLMPLSDAEKKARNAAYEADRKRLLELVELLGTKKLRVSRFVRVACPARGTTLASGRLDRWLSVLDYVATPPPAAACSPAASISCSPWSRSAPTRAPCPASRR
jgi:hypothetical protein